MVILHEDSVFQGAHYRKSSVCPVCSNCGQVQTSREQSDFSSGSASAVHLILGVGPLGHIVSSSLSVIVSPVLCLLVGRDCVLHLGPQHLALSSHLCWKERQKQRRGLGQNLELTDY